MTFKVGDRVRVFGLCTTWEFDGVIEQIINHNLFLILRDNDNIQSCYIAHSKQCRRLVKKKKVYESKDRISIGTTVISLDQSKEELQSRISALEERIDDLVVGLESMRKQIEELKIITKRVEKL